jgi:hypothetical protein
VLREDIIVVSVMVTCTFCDPEGVLCTGDVAEGAVLLPQAVRARMNVARKHPKMSRYFIVSHL